MRCTPLLLTVALPFGLALGCRSSVPTAAPERSCSRAAIAEIERAELATSVKGARIPGVSVAVYVPTRLSQPVAVASGWADYAREQPLAPDGRMLAGSIGKTLYAAAALRLVDMGRLTLDAPIAQYLPGVDVPAADSVTVRMLLSHRSGYGEYDGVFMQDLIQNPTRIRTLDDWVGPLRRNPLSARGTFRYSDLNFVLLAHIIDRVAGCRLSSSFARSFSCPTTSAPPAPQTGATLPGSCRGTPGQTTFSGAMR